MNWKDVIDQESQRDYYKRLKEFVYSQYFRSDIKVLPEKPLIFNALQLTPLNQVKVVVLGQDPYPTAGQAHGLAFSVRDGNGFPGSLGNIFKEIKQSLNVTPLDSTDLTRWARQGVLLLNSVLTVQEGKPGSHAGRGWETFTDEIIRIIDREREHVVFMLWGNYAKQKGDVINRQKHLILKAAHPSPLSANSGFLGCGHFKQANEYLSTPIDWR